MILRDSLSFSEYIYEKYSELFCLLRIKKEVNEFNDSLTFFIYIYRDGCGCVQHARSRDKVTIVEHADTNYE